MVGNESSPSFEKIFDKVSKIWYKGVRQALFFLSKFSTWQCPPELGCPVRNFWQDLSTENFSTKSVECYRRKIFPKFVELCQIWVNVVEMSNCGEMSNNCVELLANIRIKFFTNIRLFYFPNVRVHIMKIIRVEFCRTLLVAILLKLLYNNSIRS